MKRLLIIINNLVDPALLLACLAASGSYIVVPAICRYAIPEAKPEFISVCR